MKKTLMFATIALVAFAGISCKPKAEAPKAMFEYEVSEDDLTTVKFNNLSKNAATYKWEFGDNETSTETNPTHIYAEGGSYTVTLTAEGEGGTDVYSEEISLVAPKVKIDGKFNDWDKMLADKEATLVQVNLPENGDPNRNALVDVLVTTDDLFVYYALTYIGDTEDYMAVMQFSFFFDADNDATTGKDRTGYWADFGCEYQVQYGDEEAKLAQYKDDSDPGAWALWNDWTAYMLYRWIDVTDNAQRHEPTNISEKINIGDGKMRVEGRIPYTTFGGVGLTNNTTFALKSADQAYINTSGQLPVRTIDGEGNKTNAPGVKLKF